MSLPKLRPDSNPSLLDSLPDAAINRALDAIDHHINLNNPPQNDQFEESRENCKSLKSFIIEAWPILFGKRPLIDGWHIDAICQHLEAVTTRDIRNLIINIPPRHMKSLITSVFWPCWVWTHSPELSFLFASYSEDLVFRDADYCRKLVKSEWFQERWPLEIEKDSASQFNNTLGGRRSAITVGGQGTGKGADFNVIDDPHNVNNVESDVIRDGTIKWHDETFYNRVNLEETICRVIIMQRSHDSDLTGHIMATNRMDDEEDGDENEPQIEWELLKIPAEYEGEKNETSIGWQDPRTEFGELIWPQKVSRKYLNRYKARLGEYAYAGQYQQRPTPRKGGFFDRDWFDIVPLSAVPPIVEFAYFVRSWDLASTENKSSCYTAGSKIGITRLGHYYVFNVRRERMSPSKVEKMIVDTGKLDGLRVHIGIEKEGGSSGDFTDMHFQGVFAPLGFNYTFIRPASNLSKEMRARPVSIKAENHLIHLVEGEWNEAWLHEFASFPKGKWKDQVDSCSLGMEMLEKYAILTYPGSKLPSTRNQTGISFKHQNQQ